MKNKTYFLNTLLTAVVAAACMTAVVLRAFAPIVIIPKLSIPNIVFLSLVALVLDHYFAPAEERCWICVFAFSTATFGLLPLAAGFVSADAILKLAVVGGVVFTATAWLFVSIQDRLSSGPANKAAAVMSAFGLYLAAQCFAGMIL